MHDFFFIPMIQKNSSPMCLTASCVSLWYLGSGSGGRLFIVYFEPTGTSMLSAAMPDFEGGIFPAAILFKLLTSACQEGIFFVVMWRRACLVR